MSNPSASRATEASSSTSAYMAGWRQCGRSLLPSLVDVFEEDPFVEAAAFGALAARFRDNILPAHVMSRSEGLEYLQHVGQFRCQLLIRRRLRFMRLLQQLRP